MMTHHGKAKDQVNKFPDGSLVTFNVHTGHLFHNGYFHFQMYMSVLSVCNYDWGGRGRYAIKLAHNAGPSYCGM
jgi:hypothetical protein